MRFRLGVLKHSAVALTLVVAAVVTTSASSLAAAHPGSPASECPTASELADGVVTQAQAPEGIDVETCDIVGVDVKIAGSQSLMEIPEPGSAVTMITEYYDPDEEGSAKSNAQESPDTDFSVIVAADGELEYDPLDDDSGDDEHALSACSDGAYAWFHYGAQQENTIYFNRSTTPDYLSIDATEDVLVGAYRAWTNQRTDCNYSDQINRGISYGGNTEVLSDVTEGGCGAGDSTSVVSFNELTPGVLGRVCFKTNVQQNIIVAADMKLQTTARLPGTSKWTLYAALPSCNNKIDLDGVATHEAGHFWGFAHVLKQNHPYSTMMNRVGPGQVLCTKVLATLAKGEIMGMRAYYN